MTLSADQQTELELPVCRIAYFVQFEFASGTTYVCNANQTYTWNSIEWLGLGNLGGISPVQESASGGSSAMTFTLNIAQSAYLSLAIGDVTEYSGLPAKMYFCPVDEGFRLVGTPELCWRGNMDTMVVGIDGDSSQVALKCETSAYGIKRHSALRLNSEQHKQRMVEQELPVDNGLQFLNDLMANPTKWLTVKYQSR